MPNGVFRTNQFSYSFAQPEHLYASISIGAAGAPTIVSGTGMGIVSISRSSAGTYVVGLSHAYNALLGVRHTIASASAPTAPSLYVSNNSVTSSTAPAVTIVMNSAGTATDPASGSIILLEIELQKSSVRY